MSSWQNAWRTMRRSPYQTIACALLSVLAFSTAHLVVVLILVSASLLSQLETIPKAIGFFKLGASPEQLEQAQTTMTTKAYVHQVNTINQEEALKLYKEEYKDDPLLLELVTADALPASIEVSGKRLSDLGIIKSDLEKLTGIEDVSLQETELTKLSAQLTTLRQIGIGVAIFVGFIAFFAITAFITLKALTQKQAIGIMRLLGASKGYVRSPFVLEGAMYGMVGSLLAFILVCILILISRPSLQTATGIVLPWPPTGWLVLLQGFGGMLVGLVLGGSAGFMAVNRLTRR